MRLVRLGALFGSLVLLVATSVSLVNRRNELRDDQSARADAAATIGSVSVRETVARAVTAVDLVAIAASSGDVDDGRLADELAAAFIEGEACVGTPASCTGADLLSLPIAGELAVATAADTEVGALAAVDVSTESVIVVDRRTSETEAATVALRLPVDALVDPAAQAAIELNEAEIGVVSMRGDAEDGRSEPVVVDGVRLVVATVAAPFATGTVEVAAGVDGSIGIAADAPLFFGALILLGTVLMALAGWTFLAERRSLERRATTDELTGLVNRREFERISEDALVDADRFSTGLCVMVIDLNGFKQINDTLGHQFGDLVLQAVAERLVSAVRDTDVVGRWGGDEFVILLPGLAERTAVRNRAERMSATLAETPVVGDTTMTASIGAAIFPRHGTNLDTLMRAADVAMYGAKTTGVTHRIADTIDVQESILATGDEDTSAALAAAVESVEAERRARVETATYSGPDRRRPGAPEPAPSDGADADADADGADALAGPPVVDDGEGDADGPIAIRASQPTDEAGGFAPPTVDVPEAVDAIDALERSAAGGADEADDLERPRP